MVGGVEKHSMAGLSYKKRQCYVIFVEMIIFSFFEIQHKALLNLILRSAAPFNLISSIFYKYYGALHLKFRI